MAKKKMYVEIWMGGRTNPAYCLNAKSIRESIDGTLMLIETEDGGEFEVSPHNVVIQHYTESEDKE